MFQFTWQVPLRNVFPRIELFIHGMCIFSVLLDKCQSISQIITLIYWYIPNNNRKYELPVAPYPYQHLVLSDFSNFSKLICVYIFICSFNAWLLLLLLSRLSRVRLCATPRDGSPPGSPVPGILQARTLEWVAISFSNAWKWKVKVFWLLNFNTLTCTSYIHIFLLLLSIAFIGFISVVSGRISLYFPCCH